MARRGDVIHNPVTGERIRFLATAADTDGELLRFELTMPPGVTVPMAHLHPHQEERFELSDGRARFRVGRDTVRAAAGERVVVPAGVRHRFWNDADVTLRLTVEFRPALRIERFFEQLWSPGLMRSGMPGFRLATVLAREGYLDEVCLPRVPMPLQRALELTLAAVGRLLDGSPTARRWRPPASWTRILR
jgi:mannose-6-phosphate isomerase-like protein (cupin superfamily)